MSKEINDQFEKCNFTVVCKSKGPKDQVILPEVWQMQRKHDARTGQVKKYNARLNIDGSRMRHGIHYDQTYSPVASWNSVRMLLTLTAVHGWHTKQIDFVQAFAQAPDEKTLYMRMILARRRSKSQRLRPPDSSQHLWSKADRPSLEPVPCQETGKRSWIQAVKGR